MGEWGRPVLREGDIFRKNAFSDISFYWPNDQESTLGNMNFQNLTFVRGSSVQRLWQLQGQCIVNISDTGGSFSVFRLKSGNGGITSGTP